MAKLGRVIKERLSKRNLEYEREITAKEINDKFLFKNGGSKYYIALWKGVVFPEIEVEQKTKDPYTISGILTEKLIPYFGNDYKIMLERYEGAGGMRCYFNITSPKAEGVLIIDRKM